MIRNCDLGPIAYFNPQTKDVRKYYPDFIVNDFLIIEIKWIGFVYKMHKDEIRAKRKALEAYCEADGRYATLFVTNNMIKKKFVTLAKQIHEEKYDRASEHTTSDRGDLGKREAKKAARRDRRRK